MTVYAGNIIYANDINVLNWTDYTTVAPSGGSAFAITASTTAPTQGNSTYRAEYQRNTFNCNVRIHIDIGSTFAAGSGNYRFGLPFTASANASTATAGALWINDSGTALRMGVVTLDSSTTYATAWYTSAATAVSALGSAGSGTAWATNDSIVMSFIYETV